MKGRSTATIALVILALLGLVKAVDVNQCNTAMTLFKTKLEALSHYVPSHDDSMGGMNMGGTMDDPDKKKRSETAPANCIFANFTTNEFMVNCESEPCISALLDLSANYEETLLTPCSNVEGFEMDPNVSKVMDSVNGLKTCNQCVVTYTIFKKLEAELTALQCFPASVSVINCSKKCVDGLQQYHSLYTKMIEGLCHMNNPGGCGENGGITEGQIYDIIVGYFDKMTIVDTIFPLCSEECKDSLANWYSSWTPLIKEGCIQTTEVDDIDLDKVSPVLEQFSLQLQCDPECQTKMGELSKEYFKLPTTCRKGLIGKHANEISNAGNPDRCNEDSLWNTFDFEKVARGFFTISLICVGVFIIYVVAGWVYNRAVRGKKGWQAVPTIFCCWRRSKNRSRTPKSFRRTEDDEEDVVLYDADNVDDDRI